MVSTDKALAMTGFFEEARRRKVYRVAAAYIIAAGGIIQLASAAFPAWELPNWALRLVIVALLMGFPIALILAWVYDITAQGVRATPTPALPGSHRRRNIIMLVATGVIISAAAGFFLLPRVSAHKCDKSIAVLPFENLSDEKENAYFADGVQDDILTSLAEIKDLRVISRSSVTQFRDVATRNLREIGKSLGVANILEGSVRREGARVVVNVQLIDALHDRHVWANRYDRTLVDSLGLQGELAAEIADALRVTLSPEEKARVETKPTQNPDAYVFYLRANQISRNPDTLLEDYKTAEQLYMQAIALDPGFALAHARLASVRAEIFHFYEPTESWPTKARAEATLLYGSSQILRKRTSRSASAFTGWTTTMRALSNNSRSLRVYRRAMEILAV